MISFSVNVEEIDDQHKKFLEHINVLNVLNKALDNEGDKKKVISDVLKELLEYADLHFKTEEDYFDKFNYLESISHKYDHKDFYQRILGFTNLYKYDWVTMNDEMIKFLLEWFMTHILIEDRKYVECFKENGLR